MEWLAPEPLISASIAHGDPEELLRTKRNAGGHR